MNRRRFIKSATVWLLLAALGISQLGADVLWAPWYQNNKAAASGTAGTIVQSKSQFGHASTGQVTLTSVASGNLIVVIVFVNAASLTLTSGMISDGVASYALDHSRNAFGTFSAVNFGSWSRVAAATGSITITMTPGGSPAAINICAYEVSGLTFKSFDAGNETETTTTSATSGNFTMSSAGAAFGIEADETGSTITHTATSGFAISDSGNAHLNDNTGANQAGAMEHKSISSSGTVAATMTLGSTETAAMMGVGYK